MALADDARNTPTIGQIFFSNPSIAKPWDEAFREGLRELGYLDGKNIRIETRYAYRDPAQIPALVNELIGVPVRLLYVSPKAFHAAISATKTIPIVCPDMSNPTRDKVVASVARPGGNVTGIYNLITETATKRLELAMEALPGLKGIAILFDAGDASVAANANEVWQFARGQGLVTRLLPVRNLHDIELALKNIRREPAQVIIVLDTPLTELHEKLIMRSIKDRVPVVSEGATGQRTEPY